MPELLVSLAITAGIGVMGVLIFSTLRKGVTLEDQRNDLKSSQKEIALLMAKDLSESVRVDQLNSDTYPGVRREPNQRRDQNENDGLSILVGKFSQFPISARYDVVNGFGQITILNQGTSDDDQLYGLHYAASSLFKLYVIASANGKNVVLQEGSVARDTSHTQFQFTLPASGSVPFSGTQILVRPLEQIIYVVENGALKRKVKRDPSGAVIEEKVIAKNVQNFKIDYDFFDFDRKTGVDLRLPTIPLSHPAENPRSGCTNGVPSNNSIVCAGWQHIGRLNVTLEMQSPREIANSLNVQNPEGFSVQNNHLVYQSKFTLFPYGYSGLGNLTTVLGANLRCSVYDSNSRCNWDCAGSNGNFHGTNPSAPDWEGYGKPAYMPDGQSVNPDASDYCTCGTNPSTKNFKAPENDSSRTAAQMPPWINSSGVRDAELGRRYQACARHFDGCSGNNRWLGDLYDPVYMACYCTQPSNSHPNGHYSHAQWPYTFSQQSEDGIVALASGSAGAVSGERSCSTWGACDSRANNISRSTSNRFWRDRCRCLTSNENSSGVPQQNDPVRPESAISYYDICSLAAEPGSVMGSGDGYCPNTYDPTGSGHYKLRDSTANPQGLSEEMAMLCECLRSMWRTREGFSVTNNGIQSFVPSNGASNTSWDFRKAAPSGQTPWSAFGLTPNANRTTAAISGETISSATAIGYDSNGNPGNVALSNLGGTIDCSLAHIVASSISAAGLTNCIERFPDNFETGRLNLPDQYRAYSGYCRTGLSNLRPDSGIPRVGTSACGSGGNANIPEVDAIRRVITGVGGGTLPPDCGGPSGNGSFQP